MKFYGEMIGRSFSVVEAESPSDLYQTLGSDVLINDVRCWVAVKTATDDAIVWMEIFLNLPQYFEKVCGYLEDEVYIVFKRKPCNSPSSSVGLVKVADEVSSVGDSLCNAAKVDVSDVMNDEDPFTLENVVMIEDPLLLHFPKKRSIDVETICVSLSSFERFVQSESDAGKNVINLEMKRVMCKGGRERSFVISKHVWLRSILKLPQKTRSSFREYFTSAILREDQLDVIKNDKDLWNRVLIWTSDLLDFESSQGRLTMLPEDGVAPFVSPYYFSTEEAKYLGGLRMPNMTTLHQTLLHMLEGKADDGALEVCASHDLAPILLIAFEIKKGFHKNATFKSEKKKWLKKREKAVKKAN